MCIRDRHQGVLWGRREVLESLEPYKVRPAYDEIPWCFETGTQSHEACAGVTAAVDYFAQIGRDMAADHMADWAHLPGRRQVLHAAMDFLFEYEKSIAEHLLQGLSAIDGVTVRGITSPDALDRRVPTMAFTHATTGSDDIARALAKNNIFVWSGHNYAVEVAKTLGIYESGGAVRIGPVHYNSHAEIDDVLDTLQTILA